MTDFKNIKEILPSNKQKFISSVIGTSGMFIIFVSIWHLCSLGKAIAQQESELKVHSAVFALPFFGIFLVGIAIIIFLPLLKNQNYKKMENWFFSVIAVAAALFLFLMITGPFLIQVIMTAHHFHVCKTTLGTKMTITYWNHNKACLDAHK